MSLPTYDLIFGLGPACSCSETLRRAGVQHLSFPFDWVGPKNGTPEYARDLRHRADAIAARFAGWIRPEDFDVNFPIPATGKWHTFNRALKLLFIHDFPMDRPLAESFDAVRGKYVRRIARFLELLDGARRVLVVRVDRPDLDNETTDDDCRYAREALGKAFPNARFDFLVFHRLPGVPFAERRAETPFDGLTRILFDYKDPSPDAPSFRVKLQQTADAVNALVRVRDYRTAEEKRRYKRLRLEQRLRRTGAKSPWDYRRSQVVNFLQRFNLFADLKARLARRTFEQFVFLGSNCEPAFRFVCRWDFLDSSLFAWANTGNIRKLVAALNNLDALADGEMAFHEPSFMWRCLNTGITFHGRFKPNAVLPTEAERAADLADLRARIAHLREKFRTYATNEKSTLFVYKVNPADVQKEGFTGQLDALEASLAALGARNWTLLAVCEKACRSQVPAGPHRIVRSVARFNPGDAVTQRRLGDPTGWQRLFSAFAPAKVLPRAHAFKFES